MTTLISNRKPGRGGGVYVAALRIEAMAAADKLPLWDVMPCTSREIWQPCSVLTVNTQRTVFQGAETIQDDGYKLNRV